MNNFSSLQVTASFLLVIIGMIYYKAPEDGMVTECGSLLPDWKSVSAIFSLYTIVFILMFSFIRLLYHLCVRLPALRSPEGDHPAVCDPHLYVGGPAHPHRRRRLPHVLHVLRLQEGDRVDEDGN